MSKSLGLGSYGAEVSRVPAGSSLHRFSPPPNKGNTQPPPYVLYLPEAEGLQPRDSQVRMWHVPSLTFRSAATLPAKYPYLKKDPQKLTGREEIAGQERSADEQGIRFPSA